MTNARVDLRVTGKVQGVNFRYWTSVMARRLGLTGTVQNLHDGSVAVHAYGPQDDIVTFAHCMWIGPPHAIVRSVEPLEEWPALPDRFTVLR